jgi:DNA replication protein DnaC
MPMNEPPTSGQPHCKRCHGQGIIVGRGAPNSTAEFARAEVCNCVVVCPRCAGTGRVSLLEDGHPVVARCRCQILPDRAALFNRAQIPARHANSTFLSFKKDVEGVTLGFAKTFGWLESFKPDSENRGLVLWGKVGRGKTHLLTALLRELMFQHGVEARFIEFSRLLLMLKEGYQAGVSDAPILSELSETPVLAIDELGKGRLSDWELRVIDDLVSRRYNAMACTIFTSNYAPGATSGQQPANLAMSADLAQNLGDRVGDRVYSRLREMSTFVELGGPDYRELRT